jgi:Ni/Co efflux regulator RcnB
VSYYLFIYFYSKHVGTVTVAASHHIQLDMAQVQATDASKDSESSQVLHRLPEAQERHWLSHSQVLRNAQKKVNEEAYIMFI